MNSRRQRQSLRRSVSRRHRSLSGGTGAPRCTTYSCGSSLRPWQSADSLVAAPAATARARGRSWRHRGCALRSHWRPYCSPFVATVDGPTTLVHSTRRPSTTPTSPPATRSTVTATRAPDEPTLSATRRRSSSPKVSDHCPSAARRGRTNAQRRRARPLAYETIKNQFLINPDERDEIAA